MLKNKKIIIGVVAVVVLVLTVIGVQAASNKIPYYKSNNVITIQNLIPGESDYLRVDSTSGVEVLGDYRYPTLYDGNLNNFHSQNTTFTVGLTNKTINKAYKGTPFYHVVPMTRGTARNLLEPSDLTESEIQNIFNGNPQYVLDKIRLYNVRQKKDNKNLGDYYYIGDIARLSGGYATNIGQEHDKYNPTRLIWLVTGSTDIKSFTTEKEYKIGDKVRFQFTGYEYVYDNTGIDYEIVIKKDGASAGNLKGSYNTIKGQKSTMNTKQDPSHTGYFSVNTVFTPSEEGVYTATLTVNDKVMRSATKTVSFKVGNVEGEIPEPVDPPPPPEPPGEAPEVEIIGPTEVMVGQEFCLQANAADSDGTIESYEWGYNGSGILKDSSSCGLYYMNEGEQTVSVTVADNDGLTASDTHTINVLPPKPTANFTVGGSRKENRKMTLSPTHPYNGSDKTLELAPITDDLFTINGDGSETVVLYNLLTKSSYSDVQIHVYFDENENGQADEKDSGFVFSVKEHGYNAVYTASHGDDVVHFAYNLNDVNNTELYKGMDIKLDTPPNTFVLARSLKTEVVSVESALADNVLHAVLVLQTK